MRLSVCKMEHKPTGAVLLILICLGLSRSSVRSLTPALRYSAFGLFPPCSYCYPQGCVYEAQAASRCRSCRYILYGSPAFFQVGGLFLVVGVALGMMVVHST